MSIPINTNYILNAVIWGSVSGMVLAQTEITVFEFIDMLKLICFYSIIFPSWRCFQLRSWVIIFGLHRFDLILVFHNLFLPGISRITDLALWPDVFIFFFPLVLKPCQTNVLQLIIFVAIFHSLENVIPPVWQNY